MKNRPEKIESFGECGSADCSCGPSPPAISRRNFISTSAIVAGGLSVAGLPVMAGPFEDENEYLKSIPHDKKLDPAWVRSLFERGEKDVYTDPVALEHIGMPIGGFFAGTVYLSGDGRLWLWDVFNNDPEGIDKRESGIPYNHHGRDMTLSPRWGLNYVSPAKPSSPFEQGFALRIDGRDRALDSSGFSKIRFDGRYPMATIAYEDQDCPLEVELSAYSPFMPLNLDDSSLPSTIMSYKLRNTSDVRVEATMEGHLENPICLNSNTKVSGRRVNRVVKRETISAIECLAEQGEPSDEKLPWQSDFGSLSLALLGVDQHDIASAQRGQTKEEMDGDLAASLIGTIGRKVTLHPGEEVTVTFAFTWHFPNFRPRGLAGKGQQRKLVGHYYASRFDSAIAVADYLVENFPRLSGQTQAWVDTWYDSTLPYWLLDRAMANTSTLATTTCYRFKDGRFWAWEGIGCCQGTCTHVWHYAQAPGRLFPELERMTRENIDFGLSLHDDGGIGMRAGLTKANEPALDGQCGRILGVLREHQMSADDAFLKRLWPKVRKAINFMIDADGNADGILEGPQKNTLDAAWYGKISFVSSLYLAALRAGEQMAGEIGDTEFQQKCKAIAERGAKNFSEMFNGEYFYQIEDPKHLDAIASGTGCFIDQVFGQTWAHWVGLGTLFDRQQQLSALRSLWKYNFVPDVGPFREKFKLGRWYAMAGDAGLLMCTWPKGGNREDQQENWQYKYFNECMTGFEHQVAAHMVWEGIDQPDLLENGLAVERAIHDRYNPVLRNPYNEIECSDHYSRAMSSYGVFQAACGFEYNGPKGYMAFAPRLTPKDFRCPFTAAEGWGTFSQSVDEKKMQAELNPKWGSLALQTLKLTPVGLHPTQVEVKFDGKTLPAKLSRVDGAVVVALDQRITISAGQTLNVKLG